MLNVFIGYDEVEAVAFHSLVQSIIDKTTVPISITPIKLSMLPMYTRKRNPHQSNEFSFTRFLVPHLCNYKGHGVFMDCDMMIRTDLDELWDLMDDTKSVQVVKHDYTPSTRTKFLGTIQYAYPRKNWSSFMLFNCSHHDCHNLTVEAVNNAPPDYLHQMKWTTDEAIGELSVDWNHLVGEYEPNPDAKNVHWTLGGPWFNGYRTVEFAEEWDKLKQRINHCDQYDVGTIDGMKEIAG
jgi:hypothetical protein